MRSVSTIALCTGLMVLGGCGAGQRSAMAPIATAADLDIQPLAKSGSLYFAGQPSAAALEQAAERGVQTIINLRTEREARDVGFDERQTVLDLGMTYVHLPITATTLSRADALSLAAILESSPEPILMHCGTSNRVGGLWALYLNHQHHVPIDSAIERGKAAGLASPALIERVHAAARN